MAEFGQPAPVAGAQRFEKPAAGGAKPEAFPLAQLPQAQKQAVQAVSPKQPFGFAALPQQMPFQQQQMQFQQPMWGRNPFFQQQQIAPMMQNPWAAWGGFGGGFRGMLGAGMMNPGMRWF